MPNENGNKNLDECKTVGATGAIELAGREVIEAQMPPRDTHRVESALDNLKRIGGNVTNIDESLAEVKKLHGPWTGTSDELVSFAKNLFGDNPSFVGSLTSLVSAFESVDSIRTSVDNLEDLFGGMTTSEMSTAVLRGYLRNVKLLLPTALHDRIASSVDELPLFREMSEALGTVYNNFLVPKNAVDLVDGVIQKTLDETGLSDVLSQQAWMRMLPEYAVNFHDNVQLLQRLGMRVMPKCTFGKLFHKMDEPLAHIYKFAQDAYNFLDILENRQKYLTILLKEYGDLIRIIDQIYPICEEYAVPREARYISVGGERVLVDNNGRKIKNREASLANDVFDGILEVTSGV